MGVSPRGGTTRQQKVGLPVRVITRMKQKFYSQVNMERIFFF
jgi:hypothetical protein